MSDHEIRVHYWPETPELREIKIFVLGKVEFSMFLNKEEMNHFSKVLMKASSNVIENENNEQ